MHHEHGPPPPHNPDHHSHHSHHRGPRERDPRDTFIEALRLLAQRHDGARRRTGDLNGPQNVADLIVIAERALEPKVAEVLRGFDPEIDPTLAIDKLDVILAEEAGLHRREIHAIAAEGQVALVGHLPPHIHDAFVDYEGAVVVFPDDDHLQQHLRSFGVDRVVRSIPACRRRVGTADIIICDVFRNTHYYAAPSVVDLVDGRIVQAHARLLAHLRPHQHTDDIAFDASIADRVELY